MELTDMTVNDTDVKVVVEDSKHVVDLANVLKQLLSNNETFKKCSFKIDDQTKETFIYILDKYPEYFSEFKTILELIIEDGKLNIDDFTNIIKLLTKLYELVKTLKLDYDTSLKVSGDILKFILYYLIEEKKMKITNKDESAVSSSINTLIDACIELLRQNKQIEKGCNSFFKKLMCRK